MARRLAASVLRLNVPGSVLPSAFRGRRPKSRHAARASSCRLAGSFEHGARHLVADDVALDHRGARQDAGIEDTSWYAAHRIGEPVLRHLNQPEIERESGMAG